MSPTATKVIILHCGRLQICWNLESEKCLLVEYGFLGFEIRNTAQGIRNPTNELSQESKFHWQKESGIQCLQSGIHVESRIQDCCLGCLTLNALYHRLPRRCKFVRSWLPLSQKFPLFFLPKQTRARRNVRTPRFSHFYLPLCGSLSPPSS